MIPLIFSIIFLICGGILYYKARRIKINKHIKQRQQKQKLQNEITFLEQAKEQHIQQENERIKQANKDFLILKEQHEKELAATIQKNEDIIKLKRQKAQQEVAAQLETIHIDLNYIRESAQQEKLQIQEDIIKLKNSLSAGVQARLREQEKKEKINFYKLSITDADLADVKMLESLKVSFHKPVVLSKLIWTQYFQKQMTELCDRVLGKKVICGIYKITNLLTEQCYIGQSVNVADRWKQHCKCGLGIQASATNILYNAMQKDGVWNFSFELLEECPKEMLNEKEKFWINMYQSNSYGYNGNVGVKSASKN